MMKIHELSDVPYFYVTRDESDNLEKSTKDWHDDPNHNVEPTQKLESDKRVERFFVGRQGEVWIVWHITDIPESADSRREYEHIVRDGWGFTAKDGTVTVVTAHLYFTHTRAMNAIREDTTSLARYANEADGAFYSHVYELSQM